MIKGCLVLVFCILFLSFKASAFDYHQKMIEFQGGIISQLNNCGVTYNRDGIFSRGLHGVTSNISSIENDVVDFKKMNNGVVSILSDGRIYFSPNGRSIDGGNESKLIGKVSLDAPCLGGYACYALPDATILGVDVQNDFIAVLTNKKLYIYNFNGIESRFISSFDFSYTELSGWRTSTTIKPIFISAINSNGGIFYVQFSNGDIKYTNSIGELASTGKLTLLQVSAPLIRQIVPYRTGVAALLRDSRIIFAPNIAKPLTGDLLYDGRAQKKVSSIMSYGGYGSSAIFVNFLDGYSIYSPYGTNLIGGGDTIEVMKPIDIAAVKNRLASQFEIIKQQQINSYGHIVVKTELNAKILNKGDSLEFSGSWAVGFNGSNIVAANAVNISGKPVAVSVYDKGWDGIEYKWRNRGEQAGTIIHSNDFDQVGKSEVKLTSHKGCAVIGGVSQIGEFPNPFKKNISIEPKYFYSEVSGPGAPTSGESFYMNLLGVGKDLFFGDNGWNIWTFWTSGGEAFGPMMSYIQYNNNFDFGMTFDRYSRVLARKYLPGFQSGKNEVEISTNYIVRHKSGNYCFHPKGGNSKPVAGTPIILHPYCNPFDDRLLFTLLPNGSLKHVSSGMCIHPEGGTASTGRRLILWNSCSDGQSQDESGNKRLSFKFLDGGGIQHPGSGLCVHPSGGAANPIEGTELVLWSGCDEARLKYNRY